MKRLKKHMATGLVMALALVLQACDPGGFLNIDPKGSLNKDVLATQKGAEAALVGAYGALDGQISLTNGSPWAVGATNWIYGSVAGGMAHKGSTSNDQSTINPIATMQHSPVNSFFNLKWKALYEGVTRTNNALNILKLAEDVPEEDYNQITAEARFLRAHYYFELKKMFGNVPWIDENTTDFSNPNTADFKVPNMGPEAVDIWQKIEEDLTFAANNLPPTQAEVARANSWAARAYLGKAHVYQQEWQEAKAIFDNVINNGVTTSGQAFGLVDNFKELFDGQNEHNQEVIFAVEYAANVGTGNIDNGRQEAMLNYPYNSPFRCCGFFQPTQELTNSYRTDATGLPMNESYEYNDEMVTSDRGVSSTTQFTPYSGNLDPRLDWTVGRRGVPYHDWGPFPGSRWVRDQTNGGPYHAKKHIYWQETEESEETAVGDQSEWAPGSGINYSIIRFADLLLMAAEAEVELGNLDQARQYVNRVRSRVTQPEGWVNNSLNEAYAVAVVDNEADMLASEATQNEWVVRTDENATYVLLNEPATDPANWQQYEDPANNYNVAPYPAGSPVFSNPESAREAIHFERKLELALEGHRFFDLVRWGEAEEKLNAFYAYEGGELGYSDVAGGSFTPNKNEYYPIPQRQIDLSINEGEATLKQNPNY